MINRKKSNELGEVDWGLMEDAWGAVRQQIDHIMTESLVKRVSIS